MVICPFQAQGKWKHDQNFPFRLPQTTEECQADLLNQAIVRARVLDFHRNRVAMGVE